MADVNNKDALIIGGGIVGLATAYQLLKTLPGIRLAVLEKEAKLALHQSGRNSGVLHSGIYYRPGSAKAGNCREGRRAMEAFCEEEEIPFERCGKVIVARGEEEGMLKHLQQRGEANGIRSEWCNRERLGELEPHAQGAAALHVRETGIVDYTGVCDRLAQRIHEMGGEFFGNAEVTSLAQSSGRGRIESRKGAFEARVIINCAGLQADVLARMAGCEPGVRIIPFRGEYYELEKGSRSLVRNLIYPVPDPAFPFLGVHLTRTIDGRVECGPNAVLAMAREGYRKGTMHLGDLAGTLAYPGFQRLAARYWKQGAAETWRSLCKKAFVRSVQRLVPEIEAYQLDTAPAGIRAQAVKRDGTLVDDFLIVADQRLIHVCNAPSPAATASLTIGKSIVSRAVPWLT